MGWLEWIKSNKAWVLVIVVVVVGGILVGTGAITWDQFLGFFERVQPVEGGG